jgi:RNA polymerase sigma factor (sigma-70 family)
VRRASSIRKQQSLASWLYGVVQRVAWRERSRAAQRIAREDRVRRPELNFDEPGEARELQQVLDEELVRLNEKYRAPIVLCYLEGKTQEQAAAELGCPRSTLSSRITLAHSLLRKRLLRRGVALSGAIGWSALTGNAIPAAVPALLVLSTVRAAGKRHASGAVVQLADTVSSIPSPKVTLPVLLTASAALALAGMLWHSSLRPDAVANESLTVAEPAEAKEPAKDLNGDPLPAGAVVRLGTDRLRHGSHSGMLAFSRDGNSVISAAQDGAVHVWDAKTGKELRRIKAVSSAVWTGAISPDGLLVALVSSDRDVDLWDFKSGQRLNRIKPPQRGFWNCVAFAPDGKTLALANARPAEVLIFDVATGRLLRTVKPDVKVDGLTRLLFTPDGKTLMAKSPDGTIHFLDAISGKEARKFSRSNENLSPSYAISPDGETFAYGQSTSTFLQDLTADTEHVQLAGQTPNYVHALAFSPDGRRLAAGGNGSCQIWDVKNRKVLSHFGSFQVRGCYMLCFSPDGNTLATAGDREPIRLWDVESGREVVSFAGHAHFVQQIAFNPDGRTVCTLADDFALWLWDATTGKPIQSVASNGRSMAYAPDGKTLATSDSRNIIRVLDAENGRELRRFATLAVEPVARKNHIVYALAFSSNGTALKVCYTTKYWDKKDATTHTLALDAVTGKEIGQSTEQPGEIQSTFSGDAKLQASHSRGRVCDICDTASGKQLLTVDGKCRMVTRVMFAPDARILAGVCAQIRPEDQVIRLWELATGTEICHFQPKFKALGCPLAFSADGGVLAAAGDETTGVILWDLAAGREIQRLRDFGASISSLAFSPDGRRLGGGQFNGAALIWNVRQKATVPGALSEKELEQVWIDLAENSAALGQPAVWQLATRPDQAVAFLKARLEPAAAADAKRIRQLIAGLDHEKFAVREAANAELEKQDLQADELLREALTRKLSAESQRRVEAILARPRLVRLPETLRRVRAIQALEYAASPEARALLEKLATGHPSAKETQDAKAALQRISRK